MSIIVTQFCARKLGDENWTHICLLKLFRAPLGYPGKNPGTSRQKVCLPWASKDMPNFLAPPLHVKDPPHKDIRTRKFGFGLLLLAWKLWLPFCVAFDPPPFPEGKPALETPHLSAGITTISTGAAIWIHYFPPPANGWRKETWNGGPWIWCMFDFLSTKWILGHFRLWSPRGPQSPRHEKEAKMTSRKSFFRSRILRL